MANGNEFAELEIVVRGNRRELDRFEKDVKGSAANVEKSFKQTADKTERRYDRMFGSLRNGFNRLQESAKRVGQQMQRVGGILSASVTLPLLAVGGGAIKVAADFETSMSKIVALTDASREQVNAWRDDIRRIGPETGKSLDELAAGMFVVSSAGFQGAEAVDLLRSAAQTSAAGLGEMADLLRAGTGALNAFKEQGLTASRAMDILVGTASAGNFEVSELAQSLGRALPFTRTAGSSFEELGGVIALLTRTTGDANLAITQATGLMRSFAAPTKQTIKALDEMGLSTDDVREKIGRDGLVSTLQFLFDEMGRSTDRFRDIIPDSQALAAAIDILDANTETLDATFGALERSQGAAMQAFREGENDFDRLWKQIKSQVNVAFEQLGTTILPDVKESLGSVLDVVRDLTEGFGNLEPETQKMIIAVGGLLAVAGPLTVIIGTLSIAIGAISAPVALAVVAFGSLVAAGFQLWKNWDFLASEAERIWNAITDTIRNALDAFVGFIEDTINAVVRGFNWLGNQLARIPGVTHQAAEEFEFAANKGQDLSIALGGVNEEAGKNLTNFNELKESAKKQKEQIDESIQSMDTYSEVARKHGERQRALAELTRMHGVTLDDLTEKLKADSKATDENSEEKKGNAEATSEAISEAEQFARSLKEQKTQLEQSIQAYKLAGDSALDYEAALQVVQARALGLGGSIEEVIKRVQELREAEEFEAGFFKAFSDLEVVDTTGWEVVFPEPEKEGRERGETFGESLTKGMLDEFRNTIAGGLEKIFTLEFNSVLDVVKDFGRRAISIISQSLSRGITAGITNARGGLSIGGALGGLLSFGDFFGTAPASQAAVNTITGNTGAFGLAGGIANPAPSGLLGTLLAGGGIGLGVGSMFGSTGGLIGGGLGGAAGGFAGSSLIGSVLGIGGGPIGAVLGGILGGLLGDVIGGLFEDRPRLDVEVFHLGNEDEIQADIAAGINRTVGDVIRLGFDEAFRKENIFVKGKGGAEDLAEAEEIRRQVTESLTGTVDRIFGIINQLPADVASTLRQTFRNTELVFEQLVDDVSLEFDEGSSKIEQVQERWKQFIEADLPARFLTTIEGFFTSALTGLGLTSEAAESFVGDRLEEIRTTESRELRGRMGQEFLEDFQTFVQAFNFIEGNLGDSINSAINTVTTLSEDLSERFDGVLSGGIPALSTLQDLTSALLETGDVSSETLQDILNLRSGIVELAFSLTGAIGDLANFIDTLNADIVSLGGSAVGTGGARRQAISTLLGFAEAEGVSLEERQRALQQANQMVDAFAQSQLQAQQQQADRQAELISARIEGLREERDSIQEAANIRLEALREELRIAELQERLVENIEGNIQDLLFSTQSPESAFAQLARAESQLGQLAAELENATGEERVRVGEQIQELLNTRLDVSGRAFQQPSLEFRDAFRNTVRGLEELKQEIEPVRSVEEINAEILQEEQILNERLSFIDQRIEMMRQEQNALQERANELSGQVAAEVREMKERIRVQAEQILDQRLQQLQESGLSEIGIQQGQLSVLQQIRDILASPDKGTGGGRAPLPGGGVTGGTVGNTGFQGGFQSFSSFADGSGGFRNFGSGTPAMLHGIEAVVRPSDIRPVGNVSNVFNINVNVEGDVDSDERVEQVADAVVKRIRFDPQTRRAISKVK